MTESELIIAANTMYSILSSVSPSPADMQRAAVIGCKTLQRLVTDAEFFGHAGTLKTMFSRELRGVETITGATTGSIDHFKHFLELEKGLLLQGGLRDDLADALTQQALLLIEDIRGGLRSTNTLRRTLLLLSQKTCDLAEDLRRKQALKENRRRLGMRLLATGYAIGGAAIIYVNALPGAIGDLTLSPAGMAVSGAMGSVLIDKAWDAAVLNN